MTMLSNIAQKLRTIRQSEVAINSAWQFFERFVSLGCSFISSIFVIRYFAPAEYGVFAYASSYVTLFSSLTSMGLQSIAVREMVKKEISIETLMGSSFVIMLVGAIVALVLAVGGAVVTHEKNLATWVILILCLNNVVGAFAVINYYFQAEIKARYIAYIMLVQDVIDISVKIGMVHFKAQLLSFALLGLIECVCANIAIYILFRYHSQIKQWKVNKSTIKYLLHQSIPLAISGIMISLYMRLDQVMIEHYCGMKEVAEYSIGVKLVEVFYIIPMLIMPNIMPILVKKYEVSSQHFENTFAIVLAYFALISIVITSVLFVSSSYIITLLYGHQYVESVKIMRVLSFLLLPIYLGVASATWLQIHSLQKYSLYFTLLGLVSCIVFNFALIPKYSVMGAAFAILIVQSLPFSLYLFLSELRVLGKHFLMIPTNLIIIFKGKLS